MKVTRTSSGTRRLSLTKSDWLRIGQRARWVEEDKTGAVQIERYGKFWKLKMNGELLAVVVYLRGAQALKHKLDALMEECRQNGELEIPDEDDALIQPLETFSKRMFRR